MERSKRTIVSLVFFAAFTATPALAQQGATNGEWRAFGGDGGGIRYSSLAQINPTNIANLEVAWVWKSDSLVPNAIATSETTPIMADGILYFSMEQRRVITAADPATGETLWMYRIDEGERFAAAPRKVHRGVSYWTDGKDDKRIVFATPGFQLVALDAKTGRPVESFGNSGIVDMLEYVDTSQFDGDLVGRFGNSSPVVVSRDTLIVGPAMGRLNKANVKGDVLAFDARTGQKKWGFHTIPRPGEFGAESWFNNSAEYTGNAGVWGAFSADDELGIVYLAVEAPTNDVYGGARHGDNLFSSSLVAVDINTGSRLWHQQFVHHDIWDYDNTGHPILINLNVDGREVKAVVQVTKQAFAYVLNRETGAPVWPLNETPVPQTTVPNEWTSATQPIPSKPPGFDVQGYSEDNLIDFTPELRAMALEELKAYTVGPMFTPPSMTSPTNKGTIIFPGYGGGANWQSGAGDPETGFIYVGSATNPAVVGLEPVLPARPDDPDYADYRLTGSLPQLPNGLRLLKPPYGRITAYDMNKGEIAWTIPNSDTPPTIQASLDAAGLKDIPATGNPSQAGLLVTKTLLFAGEGSGGMPIFHAYDKRTGERIWQGAIPGGTQSGLPMTYEYKGRQYVVMAVNGNAPGTTGNAARLVAWALPPSD